MTTEQQFFMELVSNGGPWVVALWMLARPLGQQLPRALDHLCELGQAVKMVAEHGLTIRHVHAYEGDDEPEPTP